MASLLIDDEIVRRAQRGDAAAFAEIVTSCQMPVFNYVSRLVRDQRARRGPDAALAHGDVVVTR